MQGMGTRRRVAVIGGGPAGLTAGKQLLEEGLDPVVLEQWLEIGGQWASGRRSGVWPGMRANTSRTTTAFSDFPSAPTVAMYPRAEEVAAYLREYADHFGVREHVRLGARVEQVIPVGDGFAVRVAHGGVAREERFDAVVVASGRYRRPHWPQLPGLSALGYRGRVRHALAYRGRDEFHRRRVLVYGNSISGVEIASDLAADHTINVISAARSPRYVIPKVLAGVPTDWRWFHRFSALQAMALSPQQLAAAVRATALAETGDPARYGGLGIDP